MPQFGIISTSRIPYPGRGHPRYLDLNFHPGCMRLANDVIQKRGARGFGLRVQGCASRPTQNQPPSQGRIAPGVVVPQVEQIAPAAIQHLPGTGYFGHDIHFAIHLSPGKSRILPYPAPFGFAWIEGDDVRRLNAQPKSQQPRSCRLRGEKASLAATESLLISLVRSLELEVGMVDQPQLEPHLGSARPVRRLGQQHQGALVIADRFGVLVGQARPVAGLDK